MSESIEAATIDRLLGDWLQRDGVTRAHRQLAVALTELIISGVLSDGTAMPPQRVLARTLGVSRTTVAQALEELAATGLIVSRRGSGSRIRRRAGRLAHPATIDGRLSSYDNHTGASIDLSSGALAGLPMVAAEIAALHHDELADLVSRDGYYPAGVPELTEAVAGHLSSSRLPTTPDQLLITAGAQQATWLIAHSLIGPGDTVVVEDPSYRGALEAFTSSGARLLAIPIKSDGIDTEHLEHLVRRLEPQMLYWQPTVHNPTGQSSSRGTKTDVARIQQRYGLTVVEDGSSNDLMHDDRRPPTPFAHYSHGGNTLTVGTTSKLFWGGLRVGWIRAEASMIRRLIEAKKSMDLGCAPVEQLVAARLLQHADVARKQRARELASKLGSVTRLLHQNFADWTYSPPAGGTNLWVDTHSDAQLLTAKAKAAGVSILAGPAFSANNSFGGHIKLPFVQEESVLKDGLDRLNQIHETW